MSLKRFVPKQKEISGWLGGLSFLLRQTVFYFSAVNLVMITHVFYVTSPTVQSFFGSYWLFLVVLGLGLLALMAFEYVVMLPSMFRFQQQQLYMSRRSPIYEEVLEIKRRLEELEKWLKENRK